MRCPAGFVILALLPGSISLAQQPDSGAPKAPTTISGTVLAADGTPMRLAHVTIGRSPALIAVVQADGHGSYRIETDWTGVLTLMFTGVDHERKNVEVMVGEGGGTIGLDVRLRTYPYNDDLSNVMAIGDFNAMSLSDGARPMERQPDGTYLLEVPVAPGADTLAYQLLNTVGQGHSVNGTHSDWLVYDNGGDYRSVIRVTDGVGRIRFDPGKLRRAPDTASVAFRNPESVPARYARFVGAIQDATQNFLAQMARLKLARDSMLAWRQAYDWSDLDRLLDSALAATPDADLRATVRAGYVAHAQHVDTLTARMLLVEVPPESWKWTIGYDLLVQAIYRSGQPEAYTGYALAVLRKNTDRDVRADALTYLLGQAARQKAQDQVDLLYAWLTSEYSESFEARHAATEFDPERAIRVGRPVPAFSVPALEDSTVTYSSDALRGTVYLMEFWAVWCGPCIGELPALEAAYARYRDRGFTILSLSFDGRPEDVTKFRAEGRHKMPWLHGFVSGGFRSRLATTFQVLGIPKALLVGADGSIIATTGLRGDQLDSTLARVLGTR